VRRFWSKRRRLSALALGVVAVGAMPPFNLLPLLIPSLGGLFLLHRHANVREAFGLGWLWGMGFFVPCLYWVALSMFVDIGQFWWMVPFAVLGLPAQQSVFCGLALACSRFTLRLNRSVQIVTLAAWWTAGEWLRGHMFTGFPWVLIGYTWSGEWPGLLAGLQFASIGGIYGLSFVTVVLAILPALAVGSDSRWKPLTLCAVGFSALIAWGEFRLARYPTELTPTMVRIVSTDAPHLAEFDPGQAQRDFQQILALASAPGHDKAVIQAWPEGSVETAVNRNAGVRSAMVAALPAGGIVLAGTFDAQGSGADLQEWNSVAAIDSGGAIVGMYHKHHLVPFGEYVPLRSLLPVNQIAEARFDFSIGPGPQTIALPGLPSVAPIICYEAIFPGHVVDESNRPGWMLNVTDDGWFGRSIGPAQHFAIARVRAVEEGLPLVRSANGGISGVIDPVGRVVARLGLAEVGKLDVALPDRLSESTFYANMGNLSLLNLVKH
jgi:apolipoprotein N-acyltransferase